MARIISWVIDNKYVYIKPDSPWIYDSSWSNEQVKQHGSNVLTWSEDTYRTNFNRMYEAVTQRWGTAIDLRSDYSYYFNATGNEGVYMLTGIDGANIADYGKPFYNLVIENANTSLGLGGDYTLDVDATVKTWIYLERNGTVYLPDEVSVKYGSETVVSRTYNEPGRTRVEIDIPRGTMFTNNERNREYEITAKKNGFEGRVLFTVVGVKDGEEGMSYDLLVHPKQIKVSSDGEISNYSVTCKILKNGVEVPQEPGRFEIRYTFGIPTTDYDDVGNVYSGPISYNTLSENGDQVNFYLYVNGRIVDTDSCIVSRDGIDGGFMKLELDNEIDAVGVGSDSKLDVSTGVKFSTGMILYSAGTELTITRVVIDDGNGDQALPCADSTGKAHYDVRELNTKYATFHTTLDNGYEFGIDLRNSVKITAYGTNDFGEQGYASANYILLGIQGAEDGVTYKLMPSADYILYDPNTRLVKWGTHEAVSVDDIANESLIIYPLENGRQKSAGEIVADNEFLSYSVGITYSSAGSAVAPILNGEQPQNGTTFNLSKLFNEEVTSENATSKFVTFYWCKQISGNFVMIDRETVPVIIQGINGSSIWVELGNEIDAVGVGDDTDLDIEEDVTLGTTVRIISGGTPIRIAKIEVIKPRGTESNWDDYAESTTGFTGNDHATPDNGTHTIGYVSITLKNGFEFGPDYREAPTIKATADERDGGWSGFTQYVIKGIANGKDGYVYRLMPEVDYVTFNPNAGHDGTLDENEVSCTAYYGKYELGEEGFTNGTIYYSVNCVYDSIPDVIPDTSMSGDYVTGFTEYTSSVSLDEILSKNNYWNFKYIVFYLVIDSDMPDGTVFRELVDRETVKIISDGLDAQGNATIELTNEIDSIGLGGDTILDLPAGETRRMSTGVRVFSGGTRLSIYELTGAFPAGSNAPSGTYSFGRIPPATEDDDDVFYVDLKNGFNFGNDYKEKVIITAKARNENNETATVSAIFVLAGIKSGKDGQTYKIQPTPDYAFYDLQLGRFVGDNNISAWAYSNGKLLSGSSTYNTDYQIKYTNNVLYDLETAEQNWGSTVFKAYQPEGNNLHFDTPSGSLDREQAKVFYLAVSSDSGAHWTVVDRESVPLFINGKEGKDGVGALRFDMTNPFEVINTGEDLTLDSSSWKPYSTVVYGYEGTGKVKITCTSKPSDTSTMKVSAVTASDGFGVTVTVYLRNYTFDSTTQKLSVPLSFWFDDDHSKSGSLTYTLIAIMNGKGAEGDAYRLRTNVSRIATNATSFSPETLLAGVYLGNTLVPATIYAKYKPEGEYLSTLEQMDTRSYDTYSSYTSNALSTTITKAAGNNAKNKNGTLYIAAFDGTSVNAQFLDADDIPIQVDYDEGSASGILADLSDDVGVVGVGDNEKLEANVIDKLTTIGYIFKGRPPMKLSSVELPNNGNVITEHGGRIQFVLRNFTAGVSTSAEIAVNINASEDDYVDFRGNNPLQFNIVLHGAVEEGEEAVERTVGYSILGLKDGKDGETVHLELNADKIYHNQDTGFSPQDVRCRLYYCGEDITSESAGGSNATLRFMIKNSDWADEQGTELFWLYNGHYDSTAGDYVFSISDQEFSEYDPICIRAERKTGSSGTDADWTLLDWETVQVLRDGKDGIGGIELKFDNSPAYVTQVDGSKVVTEDVTAMTYATLYSGSTTVKLNSLTLLPNESEYDSSKVHFRSECPANGSAYVEVGIDEGFSFASLSPIMLRIEGTGTDPDTNEPVVRRATFSIYDAAGGKGERGPKTRIRDWSDETALDYQNGSDDDEFWDIVYYHNDDFGGYFGCKQDQASNTEKVSPRIVEGVGQTDDYWEYYPDYDFVATKVMSIGEWPDGWIIDKGKIQHTNKSITLTSDGEVTVSVPEIVYSAYKCTTVTPNDTVYVDQTLSTDGKKAIAYRKNSNDELIPATDHEYFYFVDHVSRYNEVSNISCYINCNKDFMTAVQDSTPIVYLSEKWPLTDEPLFVNIIIKDKGTVVYKFEHDDICGTKVSYSPILGSKRAYEYDDREAGVVDYDIEVPDEEGGSSGGNSYSYDTGDITLDPLEPEEFTVLRVTITKFSLSRTANGTAGTYANMDFGNNSYHVYTRRTNSAQYFVFDSSVTFGAAADSTEIRYNRLTSGDVTKNVDKVSLKIQSVDYQNVQDTPILTVGYPENDMVYRWKESGGTRYVYTKINEPTECVYDSEGEILNGIYVEDDGSINYGGYKYVYYDSVQLGNGLDKDKFAFTKIYGDGRVVTDKLLAVGGRFSGSVVATNGEFNGTVNATNGILTNVRINGEVNGNVKIAGGNLLTMVDGNGVERIKMSNEDLPIAGYDGGSSVIDYGATENIFHEWENSGVMWVAKDYAMSEDKVVFDAILGEGDVIGGTVAVKFTFKDCHESSSKFWLSMYLLKGDGNTYACPVYNQTSNVSNGTHTVYVHIGNTTISTSNSNSDYNKITASSSAQANRPGHYRLSIRGGGTFRKNVWGNTAFFDIDLVSTVTLVRAGTTTESVNKITFGPNGFSQLTVKGGGVSSVAHTTGEASTRIYSHYYESKPVNGIRIDKDEFEFYVNGIAFTVGVNPNNQLVFTKKS